MGMIFGISIKNCIESLRFILSKAIFSQNLTYRGEGTAQNIQEKRAEREDGSNFERK